MLSPQKALEWHRVKSFGSFNARHCPTPKSGRSTCSNFQSSAGSGVTQRSYYDAHWSTFRSGVPVFPWSDYSIDPSEYFSKQ
nr:MAG TPA: hypothetical protein [Bacteriophage sp.]